MDIMAPYRPLIIYNDQSFEAQLVAEALGSRVESAMGVWPVEGLDNRKLNEPPNVVITVGGDGTILRAVRFAAPLGASILGVNFGKVGFMTEIEPADALEMVPRYLEPGFGWVQERAMLQVDVAPSRERVGHQLPLHALNDVVVGRGGVSRMVQLKTVVNGAELTTHRADAVVVATATGSTGYALSAGGPILYPESMDILIKPVASHITLSPAVVVPKSAVVELVLESDQEGALSVDGSPDGPLQPGDVVRITASPLAAKFLRAGSPDRFYASLVYRLRRGMEPHSGAGAPIQQEAQYGD
jgi:NAD+ kinase